METIKVKIRITRGSTIAMGPGKAELLEAIIQCGSISAAAKHMRMSYKRAWDLVDSMNKSFKTPLVHTAPGGLHGGGAQVTELGLVILKSYRDLMAKLNVACEIELTQITSNMKMQD